MNEDDLMILDKFIKSSSRILLSGTSCIGKTHFNSYLNEHGYGKMWQMNFFKFLSTGKLIFNFGCAAAYEEDVTDGKGIILIGAPYKIYLERRKERGKARKKGNDDRDKFKENYIKCIKKFEEYNIPHILIDNRNDCLILDKSSFIAMLTEK
jgi:hypothetical protein